MIEKFLLYFQYWIHYLPLISCNVVPFYVGREVPRAETTANSSEFVDELILPRDKRMGGWWVVKIRDFVDLFVGYVETQTRFCHDIHVLIATDYINGLCYFDRRMGRDSIRQFSYLADLTVLDVESKDLLGFCVWIGLSASAYQNCVISINEMIGAVLSDVSLFKG